MIKEIFFFGKKYKLALLVISLLLVNQKIKWEYIYHDYNTASSLLQWLWYPLFSFLFSLHHLFLIISRFKTHKSSSHTHHNLKPKSQRVKKNIEVYIRSWYHGSCLRLYRHIKHPTQHKPYDRCRSSHHHHYHLLLLVFLRRLSDEPAE